MNAVLGRYRVLKHLTSGGMADVLLGRADGIEGFERHVVLKRIRADHARDRRFISMFLDEARLAAGLHHQSIVQVFDIGEANGEYFFAMEYIHGEDLRKVLATVARARKHVPLGLACAIVSAAAAALHYAHERRDAKGRPLGIVHRDVSPSNILIGYDGAVKVVDFGIAKAAVRQTETVAGSLKGKCSYVSPEQCKGESVDRRSDVYGLGVLLYELATTSRLFRGDNEYLVMDAIVNGRITLPQVRRPDLPNELSSIIMRALAVDPARRYQSAEELRSELDQFAARLGGNASTAALASYMKKLFGARPEPWLDLASEAELAIPGQSWSDIAEGEASRDSRRSRGSLPKIMAAAAAATATARPAPNDTAPTQKFGWEAARRVEAARSSRWPWLAAPLVVLAGVGVWKLAIDRAPTPGEDAAPRAFAASAPSAAVVAPAPSPPRRVVGPSGAQPVAAAPDPAPVTATAPIIEPPRDEPERAVTSTSMRRHEPAAHEPAKHEVAAERPAPAPRAAPVAAASAPPAADAAPPTAAAAPPSPATTPSATPAPPPSPVTVPAPSPAATVAAALPAATPAVEPAAAPAAKEIDAPIAMLSNATVSAVASDHAAQLATCEGSGGLRGEVAVSFQIDASGKVVKSQLSSTIKNPKVAACILKAVQSWKFARPPSGAARGVYRISYQ